MPEHPPLADGYHPLAPGKLATLVTYLEMTEPPGRPPRPAPAGYALEAVRYRALADFHALYRAVGARWLWCSRLELPEPELAAKLAAPTLLSFAPMLDGRRMGLLEIDLAAEGEAEIASFGLVGDAIGAGVGGWMMDAAIAIAFSRPDTRRLWLHTCHLDSPQALAFYMHMGLRPYARAVEVLDDPRLDGRLPADAGPHVPLIADDRWPAGD